MAWKRALITARPLPGKLVSKRGVLFPGNLITHASSLPAVLTNLRGIAERINLLKETIFDRVTYGEKDANLDPEWADYLPAVKDYLSTTIDEVNKNIQAIGDEIGSLVCDDNISPYFVDFAKGKWQAGRDYLDGQTPSSMNSGECRLSDESQEDVPTTNDLSAEGINPACKCTCGGQDAPDRPALPGVQRPQCPRVREERSRDPRRGRAGYRRQTRRPRRRPAVLRRGFGFRLQERRVQR